MKPIHTLALLFSVSICPLATSSYAQNLFTNGGLEDSSRTIAAPSGWSMVSNTASFCKASTSSQATPDIGGLAGNLPQGTLGNPHGGNTYADGSRTPDSGTIFDEGIQQSVMLTANTTYDIGLWQAVTSNPTYAILQDTGAWRVYINDTLLGITGSTTATSLGDMLNLNWEYRSLQFTVDTTKLYTISFMPFNPSSTKSLSMGLDDVSLTAAVPEPSQMMLFGSIGILAFLRRKRNALQIK